MEKPVAQFQYINQNDNQYINAYFGEYYTITYTFDDIKSLKFQF
jgi:hypothetical protein